MKLQRRDFLRLTALIAAPAAPVVITSVRAQSWPARPVKILVGFTPGGTIDISARLVAQRLSEKLGQQFIVENRSGANANIAAEAAARSAPDGYTLLAMSSTNTINATFYENLAFDLRRDFVFVAGIGTSPMVFEVHPSVPAKTVPEFIALAKQKPGVINMASFGVGSISHVCGELFKSAAGIDVIHVPYRGSAPMVTDLVSGQVQSAFDGLPPSIEQIKAGNLRALAVTSAKRISALPDVPTLAEFVKGFEVAAPTGLAAPRGTPVDIVERLNREVAAVLADPTIVSRLAALSVEPLAMTTEVFGKFVADDIEKWGAVIRKANIKPEQ